MSRVAALMRLQSAASGSASQPRRLTNQRSRCVPPMPVRQMPPHSEAALLHGTEAKMTSPEACA